MVTSPPDTAVLDPGPAPDLADAPEAVPAAHAHVPSTRLILARHAVTAHTGPRLSGRMPGVPLSDEGNRQADALGERLACLPVAAVYSSPIERTAQTAQAVADRHGLTVTPLAGVIEADYGEWTGEMIADLVKTELWKQVQRMPSRVRFPGGESIAGMQTRMVEALEAVAAAHVGELVVVVSHADPIKAALAHYTGMHLDHFQRLAVSPASVSVVELGAGGVTRVKYNDTGSLSELVPKPVHNEAHDQQQDEQRAEDRAGAQETKP